MLSLSILYLLKNQVPYTITHIKPIEKNPKIPTRLAWTLLTKVSQKKMLSVAQTKHIHKIKSCKKLIDYHKCKEEVIILPFPICCAWSPSRNWHCSVLQEYKQITLKCQLKCEGRKLSSQKKNHRDQSFRRWNFPLKGYEHTFWHNQETICTRSKQKKRSLTPLQYKGYFLQG